MSVQVQMVRGSSKTYRTGEMLRSATQEFIGLTKDGRRLSDVALEKLQNGMADGIQIAWSSVKSHTPVDEGLLRNCIGYTLDGTTIEGLNSEGGHMVDESAYEEYCSMAGDLYHSRKNSVAAYITAFAMRSICISGDPSKARHDPEKWYNNVNYAVYVEFGTHRTPAQHFMRLGVEDAMESMRGAVVNSMKWVRG